MKKNIFSVPTVLILALIISSAFLYEFTTPWLLLAITFVAFRDMSVNNIWRKYTLSYFMMLYLAWLFVVAKYSQAPINSLMLLPTFAALPLVYLVVSNMQNFSNYWKLIRLTLFIIAVIFGFWGDWQVYAQIGKGHAVGPLVDRNAFAAILNLLWFPAVFLFLSKEFNDTRWSRVMVGIGIFVISTALFATTSRGGIAAWMLLLPILIYAGYQYSKSKTLVVKILLISALAHVFSTVFLDVTIADRSFDLANDSSTGSRLMLWQSSIEMAKAHPWLGTGWGTWGNFYPAFRLPAEISSAGYYAHNDYLQFASEGGLFATMFLVGLLISVLVLLKRNLRQVDNPLGLESVALLLGVLAVCLQAGLNFVFYFSFINIVVGLYLARVAQLTDTPFLVNISSVNQLKPSVKRLALGLLAVFIAFPFLLHQLAAVCLTDKYTGMKVVQFFSPKANGYDLARLIAGIRPKETISQNYLLNYTAAFMGDEANLANISESAKREIAKDTVARFDITRRYSANRPSVGVREVEFLIKHQLLLDGSAVYEKAHQVLQENLKTDPYHVKSMIAFARLQAAEGQTAEAIATLQKASNQVLGLHDLQLIKVELLRQHATPKVIPELDAIEKDLQLVLAASEKGQYIKLPENYYQNINLRLDAVSKSLQLPVD